MLQELVAPETAGDPMSEQQWVRSSLRQLSRRLCDTGHPASPPTVGRLLDDMGYALHVNAKNAEASTGMLDALRQRTAGVVPLTYSSYPKFEVKRYRALGHSNDYMAVAVGGYPASTFAGSALQGNMPADVVVGLIVTPLTLFRDTLGHAAPTLARS